jgi:hypothetical protein
MRAADLKPFKRRLAAFAGIRAGKIFSKVFFMLSIQNIYPFFALNKMLSFAPGQVDFKR